MPYNAVTRSWMLSDEMGRLAIEKKAGVELHKRKYEDWTDNYDLYRNKVKTNRLTQRQAVNIPLMKETVKTLLSKIDEPPSIKWKERGGDDVKQLMYQSVWDENVKENNLELIDILDKKNVLLYGISTKKLNIDKNGVTVSVLDVYDVCFDPLMNPWDIESGRFIIHQNIYRSVKEILADKRYSKTGKDELKIWADSPPGIIQSGQNKEEWEKKMKRLEDMGVQNKDFNYFAGGDLIVNLTEHYTRVWNTKTQDFEKRVVVYADDKIELLNETLEDLIGVDFWPFVMWSEDPETNDVYPDAVADLVRTPNKVLNVWFSQMIENRTLKNFQMHWYMPGQDYQPQTYTPGAGMMLPAPPGDDINKVIKPVEISGLDDTLDAINALVRIVERGTGATAIDKGQTEAGQQTLGEVEILVGKATERATAMAKFYRLAWYELAWKWDKLMHANGPKFFKLFKVAQSGKVYPKTIFKKDWVSAVGYEPLVQSSSEQEAESVKTIQKFMFITQQFPDNMTLRKISQRHMLEAVDLSPEELRQIEEEEEKKAETAMMQIQQPAEAQPENNQQLQQDIQGQLAQLAS